VACRCLECTEAVEWRKPIAHYASPPCCINTQSIMT
jgi:hypothetical protein